MTNKDYFVKYLNLKASRIDSRKIQIKKIGSKSIGPENGMLFSDRTVADLIDAYKEEVAPLLKDVPVAQLDLHLPGMTRAALLVPLPEKCFTEQDGTAISDGCLLSDLDDIITTFQKPFVLVQIELARSQFYL